MFWTLPTSFLVGAAAASGIALINSLGSLGGFVAPIAKTWAEGRFGPNAGLMLLAAIALTGAALIYASKWVLPVIKATDGKNVTETHFAQAGK